MATLSEMQKLQSYSVSELGSVFVPIRSSNGWDIFYGRYDYDIYQGVEYAESTLFYEFRWNPVYGFYTAAHTGVIGYDVLNPVFSAWVVASPTSAVPIPAAAWLLGSGMIGIVALKRRFHH